MALKTELLKAIDLTLAGDWNATHGIVQEYESDATAAWIHAILHKMEGEPGNSRYWYHHAGKLNHANDEPHAELESVKSQLAAS